MPVSTWAMCHEHVIRTDTGRRARNGRRITDSRRESPPAMTASRTQFGHSFGTQAAPRHVISRPGNRRNSSASAELKWSW